MNLATQIADVFNHVHQSHADGEAALADAAQCIANVLAANGLCSREAFLDVASMSGLPCDHDQVTACCGRPVAIDQDADTGECFYVCNSCLSVYPPVASESRAA